MCRVAWHSLGESVMSLKSCDTAVLLDADKLLCTCVDVTQLNNFNLAVHVTAAAPWNLNCHALFAYAYRKGSPHLHRSRSQDPTECCMLGKRAVSSLAGLRQTPHTNHVLCRCFFICTICKFTEFCKCLANSAVRRLGFKAYEHMHFLPLLPFV